MRLEKSYEPADVERRWYAVWEERGYFRPEAVRRLFDEHVDGTRNRAGQLWTLMMLELWHREVADRATEWIGQLSG